MEDISRNTSENIKENNDISDNNDNGKIARIKELVKAAQRCCKEILYGRYRDHEQSGI